MNAPTAIPDAAALATLPMRLAAAWNSDVGWSFRHSPVAIVSALVLGLCLAAALFAPWVAPHNPFDLRTLNLLDALAPPAGMTGSKAGFLLGTDDQGRDRAFGDHVRHAHFAPRRSRVGASAMVLGVFARARRGYAAASSTRSSCASPMCSSRFPPS
jgi:ABC-type antimicrobial peptide transport system permease subunit